MPVARVACLPLSELGDGLDDDGGGEVDESHDQGGDGVTTCGADGAPATALPSIACPCFDIEVVGVGFDVTNFEWACVKGCFDRSDGADCAVDGAGPGTLLAADGDEHDACLEVAQFACPVGEGPSGP